jgi:hypothetical protein
VRMAVFATTRMMAMMTMIVDFLFLYRFVVVGLLLAEFVEVVAAMALDSRMSMLLWLQLERNYHATKFDGCLFALSIYSNRM